MLSLSVLINSLPLLAYLFGSISSAIVVCRVMGLPDPRSSGSGNPGATNVLRFGGKKAAVITLAGDILKGLLAVWVAMWLSDSSYLIALVGVFVFWGHLYPLFFGFNGGKGVATAAGVFIGLHVGVSALLLLVWLATALVFRYSSLAALVAAASAPWLVWWLVPAPGYVVMSMVIAALLCWRHRANIRRLLAGEESKIKLGAG